LHFKNRKSKLLHSGKPFFQQSLKVVALLLILHGYIIASDPLLAMGDSLLSSGFYDEAITEYDRYLFFNPNSRWLDDTYSKIGYCYAHLEKWDKSFEAMDKSISFARSDSSLEQRKIDRAVILLSLGNNDEAQLDLGQMAHFSNYEVVRKRSGMLLFLSETFTHDWKAALHSYRSLIKSQLFESDSLESILIEASEAGYKSPNKAMLISTFIPGGGQMYTGRWLSGLNAMLLDGALGYLTVDCFVKERYVTGFLVFIFPFQRYYNGNRYQAYHTAIEHNDRIDRRFEKEILNLIRKTYNLSDGIPIR
jgi:tetratricopeptide (TPR) repeat protein